MLKAYTDGACRKGNPGVTSSAWVLLGSNGAEIASQGYYWGLEVHTNNYSEYQALVMLLEYLRDHGVINIDIYCDSKLVVEQVNQRWNCISQELRPLMSKAYALLIRGNHKLHHCEGHTGIHGNELADLLCNQVLDEHEIERGSNWEKP